MSFASMLEPAHIKVLYILLRESLLRVTKRQKVKCKRRCLTPHYVAVPQIPCVHCASLASLTMLLTLKSTCIHCASNVGNVILQVS